jgi:hypothetical protein
MDMCFNARGKNKGPIQHSLEVLLPPGCAGRGSCLRGHVRRHHGMGPLS